MTESETIERADLSPVEAWSQRVRKVGGYIQLAFAGSAGGSHRVAHTVDRRGRFPIRRTDPPEFPRRGSSRSPVRSQPR